MRNLRWFLGKVWKAIKRQKLASAIGLLFLLVGSFFVHAVVYQFSMETESYLRYVVYPFIPIFYLVVSSAWTLLLIVKLDSERGGFSGKDT